MRRNLDAYAKELACYALLVDGEEAEKAHSQPLYQYFHVTIDDSEKTAGEAIAKLSDYSAPHSLLLAFEAALKQNRIDSHERQ